MTATTLNLRLPTLYGDLLVDGSDHVRVEHAALDVKAQDSCAAMALTDLMGGVLPRTIVLVVPDVNAARTRLTSWLERMGTRSKRAGNHRWFGFINGTSTLWVADAGSVEHLPNVLSADEDISHLYMVDAHAQARNPLAPIFDRVSRSLIVGRFSPNDHWYYGECRRDDVSLRRWDATEVLKALPNSDTSLAPREGEPEYRREMLLIDEPVDHGAQSLSDFAGSRLFIRTDKPRDTLSDRQLEVAKGQGRVAVVPFVTNAIQRVYLDAKRKAVEAGRKPWYILVKYRRGGFTTLEQAASYRLAAQHPFSNVITLAHTREATTRIFNDIVGLMHERDPRAPKLLEDSKGALRFAHNNSRFYVGTAGGDALGRGDTTQKAHWSEVAWSCKGDISKQRALLAALTGAAEHGEVVLESTPNGREMLCEEYEAAKEGDSEFTALFLPWYLDPRNRESEGTFDPEEILETMDADESELALRHGLSPAQIAFRRRQRRIYKALFPQEMPENDVDCFALSGTCFFPNVVEILERIKLLGSLDTPPWRERKLTDDRTGRVAGYERVYEDPEPGARYCAGVDTSEGLEGCDRNGVGVVRQDNGKPVYSVHGLFGIRQQARHAVEASRRYNDALTGIERQNHGHAVINEAMNLGLRRPHYRGGPLYYYKQGGDEKDMRVGVKTGVPGRPGWDTGNPTKRDLLLDTMATYLEDNLDLVDDMTLLREATTFRLQLNGRFDHDATAHDDCLFKYSIAQVMRSHRRGRAVVTSV